jgi:hypothetical protein
MRAGHELIVGKSGFFVSKDKSDLGWPLNRMRPMGMPNQRGELGKFKRALAMFA